jgi:protein gp37
MATTSIEWTDKTWNPTTGCTRISDGCKNCYAFQLHDQRHKAFLEGKDVRAKQYARPFKELQLFEDRLTDPLSWKKPCRVFVNSMSDLFHKDVPDDFLDRVFAVMALAGRHTFQVLTKRPERMAEYLTREMGPNGRPGGNNWLEDAPRAMCMATAAASAVLREREGDPFLPCFPWPLPNVWLGTSVENQAAADERHAHLMRTPAAVHFWSAEPLLGPIDTGPLWEKHGKPAWVIVGGESGPGARPCRVEWLRSLRNQCAAAGVAYFLKQFGSAPGRGPVDDEGFPWCWRCGHFDFGPCADGTLLCNGCDAAWTRFKDAKGGDPAEWPHDLRAREFPGLRAALADLRATKSGRLEPHG